MRPTKHWKGVDSKDQEDNEPWGQLSTVNAVDQTQVSTIFGTDYFVMFCITKSYLKYVNN